MLVPRVAPGRQEGTRIVCALQRETVAAPATVSGEPSSASATGKLGRLGEGNDPQARRPASTVTQPVGGAYHTERLFAAVTHDRREGRGYLSTTSAWVVCGRAPAAEAFGRWVRKPTFMRPSRRALFTGCPHAARHRRRRTRIMGPTFVSLRTSAPRCWDAPPCWHMPRLKHRTRSQRRPRRP